MPEGSLGRFKGPLVRGGSWGGRLRGIPKGFCPPTACERWRLALAPPPRESLPIWGSPKTGVQAGVSHVL